MKRKAVRRPSRERDARRVQPAEPEPVAGGPPFDAGFFLGQLAGFVRDRCPPPEAGLPKVELHLADGEVFDLCHVIGVAPSWAALAVIEPGDRHGERRMRTELVPYASILRVTVRSAAPGATHVGFDTRHAPRVLAPEAEQALTPEGALRVAARPGGRLGPAG